MGTECSAKPEITRPAPKRRKQDKFINSQLAKKLRQAGLSLQDTYYRALKNTTNFSKDPIEHLERDLDMLRQTPHLLSEDHPFYCMKYVFQNRELPTNLLALRKNPHYESMKQELIRAVKSDNWDEHPILSHKYMREKFPDDEVAPLLENLALLVRQEGGHFSEAEYENLSMYLSAKEQFSGEKASIYRTRYLINQDAMTVIKNSPVAQEKLHTLVHAAHSGNWDNDLFNHPSIALEGGESVKLKDVIAYADREGMVRPSMFRMLFAWADAKQDCLPARTPMLHLPADSGRLDELKHVMETPDMVDLRSQLLKAAQTGEWESDLFSRTYMRRTFPDLTPLPSMAEVAQLAHQNGELSDALYQVTMLCLNAREQYGEKFIAADRKLREGEKEKKTVWQQLLAVPGTVTVRRLFDENKELTSKGREYLEKVDRNIAKLEEFTGYKLDNQAFVERLKKLPSNLQTFLDVDDMDAKVIEKNPYLREWFKQVTVSLQAPLLGGKHTHSSMKKNWETIDELPIPSAGVDQEFCVQFWASKRRVDLYALSPERKAVAPRRFYGRLSTDTRNKLNLDGIHPVLCYHPDITDNFHYPHNTKPAVAFASLHDTKFHTLFASMLPLSTRTAVAKVLPDFILNMVGPATLPLEKAAAQALIDQLKDLAMLQKVDDKDGAEKVFTLQCVNNIRRINHPMRLQVDNGVRYESAVQVAHSRFYLNLLKEISQHQFPPPYGKDPRSMANLKPVFSGEWRFLTRGIITALHERIQLMSKYGWNATPDGKEFIRDLYTFLCTLTPPSPQQAKQFENMLEKLGVFLVLPRSLSNR